MHDYAAAEIRLDQIQKSWHSRLAYVALLTSSSKLEAPPNAVGRRCNTGTAITATMRPVQWALPILSLASLSLAKSKSTDPLESNQILPSTFKPPQVFQNADLVRTINLEKGYPRETVNVIVENIDKSPQSEYYLPFDGKTIGKIGSFEVKDKNDASKKPLTAKVVEIDSKR